MRKPWRVVATLLTPVVTRVEAETEAEAIAIARERDVGDDASTQWVLDESAYKEEVLN